MNKTELSVDSVWKVALKVIVFIILGTCSSPVTVLRVDSSVNKATYDFFRKKNKPLVFTGY